MTTVPNRIEKQIQLKAPRSRVWRAITNAKEFGTWFEVKLDGELAAGQPIEGTVIFKNEPMTFKMTVDRIEPEHLFSFRWIPFGIDKTVDYSSEEPTLVEFTLEEKDGGTLLKVVESGFDHVALNRRAKAFEMNSMGWGIQMTRIEKYLENVGK
ncbi:MAG: SRPBCC family protein [Polyangiaceae bacterium]